MTVYQKEQDEYSDLQTIFNDTWDDHNGSIPKPNILLAVSSAARFDLNFEGDTVILRMSPSGQQITYRDQYSYFDKYTDFILEVWTKVSRQRLLDMKREIMRITMAKLHKPAETNYQLLRYKNFIEQNTDNLNIWKGIINISLESSRLAFSTIT